MRNFVKTNILAVLGLFIMTAIAFTSCTEDEASPMPVATFQFEISETNQLEVSFFNFSSDATTYLWDFGDGAGTSTDENPTYTYSDGGTYTVTLVATGDGGVAEHSKDVTVINPQAANLIENGEFDDESVWTILQHNTNNNGLVTIADGVCVFDEVEDFAPGSWGSEAHAGINQAVTVTEGTYQLDLDIITTGLEEVWFEVWVGLDAPVAEQDYNEDNNATKVLAFNSWDCAETNNVYEGPMAAVSCQDTDGSIQLSEGTYYVVIRTGGFTFGTDGIIIDNVSMVKVN